MKGYLPCWQQLLKTSWPRQHQQQQQVNNQPVQQQGGQQIRQWPLNSCMVTVERFKSHIDMLEQPESEKLHRVFAGVLSVVPEDVTSSNSAATGVAGVGQFEGGDVFKASELPEVQRFRAASCSMLQGTSVDSVWQYRLSYTAFDKQVFACSWLQKHQHIKMFGRLTEGEYLVACTICQ